MSPALVARRYELVHELARGGMGVVYQAHDRVTGQLIALKRSLSASGAPGSLAKTMLQREYQTLVTLRHPHIIQVHDFGFDEEGPYYTMELLDGADLRVRCPLPWRDVCLYLRDVASSLCLLHSRRLVHSDVTVGNIRLTSEGRAKLLDFGALSSFGKHAVITGTPPTTAPEVLEGRELDQRVDLYALGATAYYALCGQHAYPATALGLLATVWARGRPAPPSAHVASVPRELDELVLALLDLDRASRPASAAEVIDRLGAIAGLAPDHDQRVQRSYLHSAHVIGRDAERRQLADKLEAALAGRAGGVIIEGAAGLGKTFLLEDTLRAARFAGARVLTVQARAHPGSSGVWRELVREAHAAGARPSAPLTDGAGAAGEITRLAQEAPLVLAVDDLQEADSDSLVALAALVRSTRTSRVLLIGTLDGSHTQVRRLALKLLRERLGRVVLEPFDEAVTHEFVTGLFGDVAASARLSAFLRNHAAGNPRACTEVIQHLITQGFIRYAEGTWILPDELPTAVDLGSLVESAFESRIAGWSPALRALALSLSPHRRVFSVELCNELARSEPELAGKRLPPLLRELVREGVLVEDRGAYAFERSRHRELLYGRLGEEERRSRHARLAQALAATTAGNLSRGFEIGFHQLLSGQRAKARAQINRSIEPSLFDPDQLIASVPDLWSLLEQQRGAGASDQEVQFVEGLLVVSGYYLDPTVQDRFAARVLPLLHRTVGFALAARLAPWLGHQLALAVGLLVAWLKSLFRRPYLVGGRSPLPPLLIFIAVSAALSGGACFRLDLAMHPRLRAMFAVARRLGQLNGFRLLHDLFEVGAQVVRGRFAEAERGLEDQLRRLPRVPMLTGGARHHYEAALHFFIGRNQLLRLDSTSLQCAERIDALGGNHDRLMAHFLRRTYHLYRGDITAAKREEEHFDEMAGRFGSRWVADMMSVLEILPYHLSGDVLGLKRALHRIERLVAIAPGLAVQREVIRAMYEGHRGRPERALAIYTSHAPELGPFSGPCWAAARAHQAECLNALGRHDEALAVCAEARSHLTSADRVYVLAYQQLERESAAALAGLGRHEPAAQLCDGLLAECAGHDNPLVRGLLSHDRASIALAAGDGAAFAQYLAASIEAFATTACPSLIAKARRLFERGVLAGLVGARDQLMNRRHDTFALVPNERAERIMREAASAVGAKSACLYSVVNGTAVLGASCGDASLPMAVQSQIEQIATELRDDASDDHVASALSALPSDPVSTRTIVPLVALVAGDKCLLGILVLGDCEREAASSEVDFSQLASGLWDDGVTEALGPTM